MRWKVLSRRGRCSSGDIDWVAEEQVEGKPFFFRREYVEGRDNIGNYGEKWFGSHGGAEGWTRW
jgi:hypothetical protein